MRPCLYGFVVAVVLFVGPASSTAATWTKVGPEGATVRALAIDPTTPTTLYAGTDGGVARSVDGGATWSDRSAGLDRRFVLELAIDPFDSRILWAAVIGGFFRSTDGGASWRRVDGGLGSASTVALTPLARGLVYAGSGTGFSKSADGGATWRGSAITREDIQVTDLAVDPGDPDTVYAALFRGGVFKSTNGGTTWAPSRSGLTDPDVEELAIDPAHADTLYAATRSGVFKSTDAGATWNPTPTVGFFNGVAVDPFSPTTVVALPLIGSGRKSADGGQSWDPIDALPVPHSVAFDPVTPGTLYVGAGFGVAKSIDGGATWTTTTAGLRYLPFTAVAVDPHAPSTVYAASFVTGVARSTDDGATWVPANGDLPVGFPGGLAIAPTVPSTLYLAQFGVYRSRDGGAQWEFTGPVPIQGPPSRVTVDPVDPATVYAYADPGLGKTTNGGASWTKADAGLPPRRVTRVVVDFRTPTTLYAATAGGGVYRSIDGAATWGPSSSGLFARDLTDLALDPLAPATLYAASAGVEKSTDGGASWSPVSIGLPEGVSVNRLVVDPARHRVVYAGFGGFASPGGVFATMNGGARWERLGEGLTGETVEDVAVAGPGKVYAATTSGGLFRLEVAQCETAADCDDASLCTTDACAPPDPEAALDGCTHAAVACAAPAACRGAGTCVPETGACTYPPLRDGTPCDDDGEPCTADTCRAGACVNGPRPACRASSGGVLVLSAQARGGGRLRGVLEGTAGTTLADLGAPLTSSGYRVCLFEQDALVLGADVPPGDGWRRLRRRRSRGFRWQGDADGLDALELRVRRSGWTIAVEGRGRDLALPALPLAPPVSAQVLRADSAACWGASAAAPTRNDSGHFKAPIEAVRAP